MAMWKGAGAKLRMKYRCRAFCSRAEVSVFWDLNKCGLADADMEGDGESECQAAVDASNVVPNIVKSLRSSGYSGPISIRAYGNTRSFSNHRIMQALLATGVDLQHTSAGKNYLSKHLILDLLLWVRENSPPAHMLLISGDKEFSSVLHKLHMRGYNVLLAHPEGDISKDLLSAASKVWVWDKMMKATEVSALSPKYNCLPQSYRAVNPIESLCCYNQEVQPERVDMNQDPTSHGLKRKPLNIPKKIVEQVLDIIRSRPSGFSVSALRRQLVRSNVTLDKDLYGHKDLLSFLLAIPNLKARLLWTSDKTRTFVFTENLDESTNIIDSKFKSMLGERCSVIKMKPASCCQQLNDHASLDQSSEESIAKVSAGVDLLPDDRKTKSPEFFSGGANTLSSLWNKTLFQLMALKNVWQFVSPKAAKTQQICPRSSFTNKGRESKPIIEIINAESHISSVSSPSPEKEEKGDIAHKSISKETIEGDRPDIMHQSLENEQVDGKAQLLRKRHVLGSPDSFETQHNRSQTILGSEGRGRQSGRNIEDEATTVLHGNKLVLTDARLTNELCEDAILYLLNEGCTMCTRSITVDAVLKFLVESNHKCIAHLKQEDLIQLSKVYHEKIMLQIERETMGDNNSERSKNDKVSKGNGSNSASTSTKKNETCQLTDKEGGIAMTMSKNVEKNCCGESTFNSSIEQSMVDADVHSGVPETNVCSEMCAVDTRNNLKKMLLDMLQSLDSEVQLASVKSNFKARYGYALNNKALGYPSLSSLISSLEEFTVIGRHDKKVGLRASEHAVDKGELEEEVTHHVNSVSDMTVTSRTFSCISQQSTSQP